MKIELNKEKDDYYIMDRDQKIILKESVIFRYHLFTKKELSDEEFFQMLEENEIETYTFKALTYFHRYLKSVKETEIYLTKNVSFQTAQKILALGITNGDIREEENALEIANTHLRNSKGPRYIEAYLHKHLFAPDSISFALENRSLEDEQMGIEKLRKKLEKKYDAQREHRSYLIQRAFYQHGYDSDEISSEV